MTDLEEQRTWLERLQDLNEVIAATGQPLTGNLFYLHLQADFVSSPPNPVLRMKRERFRRAVAGRARLLEVGVNGGHSAYLALSSNPALQFHGVDICEHAYVRPVVAWLQREFPGRVHFHPGNSLAVLRQLEKASHRFDCFHIDGAKHAYYEDILNCQRMVEGQSAVVVVDDTHQPGVARTWRRCQRQGIVQPLSDFPSMPQGERFQHQIGLLLPAASPMHGADFLYARAITMMGHARFVLARVRRAVRTARPDQS
jgi:hypothetical protein